MRSQRSIPPCEAAVLRDGRHYDTLSEVLHSETIRVAA
jgi:hypothetical protein